MWGWRVASAVAAAGPEKTLREKHVYMYTAILGAISCAVADSLCFLFKNKKKQHTSDCLGCAVSIALPCCLFDLACCFLSSFSHLSLKHVHCTSQASRS